MKKFNLFMILILFFFSTNCDLLKSPEATNNGTNSCEITITEHSYGYEVKGGQKLLYYNVTVKNEGTANCSCTLTIDSYGKNDQLLEKTESNIGTIKAGETKTFKIDTNVLYDDLGSYKIEINCSPS